MPDVALQNGGGIRNNEIIPAGCAVVWNPDGTPQALDNNGDVSTPGSRIVKVTLDEELKQAGT